MNPADDREKRRVSDIGPVLAMNGREMKTTQQLDGLGQNRWPDNITRNLREIKALRRIGVGCGNSLPVLAIDHKTGTTVAIFKMRRCLTWV
jgi:hypothetical protein